MIKNKYFLWFILFLNSVVLLNACTRLVSYYDVVTYKNLTDLYAETKMLTQDCKNNAANGSSYLDRLSHLRLTSAQALEYEQGKALNENTIAQLEKINKSVEKMYQRYGKNELKNGKCVEQLSDQTASFETGCLRPNYCASKMEVMTEKFKIALETESLKIKSDK